MTDEHEDHEHTWGLTLAFDSDDPEFCRGVDVGRMYELLHALPAEETLDFTCLGWNAEMILRLAESFGRSVESEETRDDWLNVTFGPATAQLPA
jgi:hypothetical protein